ncbi:MAG: hypothetical protein F6K31_20605 [Symploca sp. SIO2G7]|nr:hypothetical protein [Symploca sp. SIO2G7]
MEITKEKRKMVIPLPGAPLGGRGWGWVQLPQLPQLPIWSVRCVRCVRCVS